MASKIDPKNLSNLYFSDDKSPHMKLQDECYFHPSIAIRNDSTVVHGRGMVVTQGISAGECLFVTPPTLGVGMDGLKKRFLEDGNMKLEDVAIELLIDAMTEAITRRQQKENLCNAAINSFMALMGATTKQEKEVTVDLLNAKDDRDLWSEEELSNVTRTDLRNVILKNAFGPDFVTHEKIEQQWNSPNSESSSYTPPQILGIFPLAAMLNHSCTPNTVRSYANGTMIVHATKTIPAGSEVVWSYIPPTQVFAERRRALKRRHGFLCKCERCLLEAKELRKDILPSNLKSALEDGTKWNEGLMDVASSDDLSKRQLCTAFVNLEETVFSSKSLSNDAKRHLRVGYTNLHFNYFNAMLMSAASTTNVHHAQVLVLNSATQLHFAFCSSNNASTEHLSVLHLCYELANTIHQSSSSDRKTLMKVKFWTEAIKRAHMTRFGEMGSDVEAVRNCLVHTRTILRQRDGYLKVKSNFL